MKRSQNRSNLDTNKPLPIYKNMDNSMNSLTLNANGSINTNINPRTLATQFLPSITTKVQPMVTSISQPASQKYMYGMLSNIQNNISCGSCGGSK